MQVGVQLPVQDLMTPDAIRDFAQAVEGAGYEYEALGENFKNRGRRMEEQIELLRRFWTEPLVTFEGRWHHIDRLGVNPLPVQRPIPIWFGTYVQQMVEPALQRLGRLADGWL